MTKSNLSEKKIYLNSENIKIRDDWKFWKILALQISRKECCSEQELQ